MILSAAPLFPLPARAQTATPMARVGVLVPGLEGNSVIQPLLVAFEREMARLGWLRGKNLQLDIGWAGTTARDTEAAATGLLAFQPNVLLAFTTRALAALRNQTQTIAIVFVGVSDPVAQGFVASFAHPGGNITGFAQFDFSVGSKWLEFLRRVAPGISRASVLFNPGMSPQGPIYKESVQAAAPATIDIVGEPVHTTNDIESAIERAAQQQHSGLIIPTDGFLSQNAALVVGAAAHYRLPAVYGLSEFVGAGGLLFYGTLEEDELRQGATYVDRILRGAKPGDLPIQNPTKFRLVINLKTAKTLGLSIPESLLVQADQVIE